MNKITYADKVELNENASIDDINKVTANDMNQIKSVVNSLANLLFPIGQIIIKGDNEDYSDWLGFSWERTAVGKVLVGLDTTDTDFNAIGKIGGEKTHILTVDEMPSHTHGVPQAHPYNKNATEHYTLVRQSFDKNTEYNVDTSATGGGEAHNNMPPYQVVAYWKRIA
jgi:hypothetical protein